MTRNRFPRLAIASGDHGFSGPLNRARFIGLAVVLVGVSQLPIAFIAADATGHDGMLFVVGAGGWLLISIGVNLLRDRSAFDDGWTESERVEWLLAGVTFVSAVVIAVAAVFIVLSVSPVG